MRVSASVRRRAGLLSGLFAATLMLLSCGGDAGTDPLAGFRNQSLAWRPCDPTIVPEGAEAALGLLGDRARCALMRAPLDYADPAGGELQLALLRVAAEGSEPRRGALLFNPGGPGGDGLDLAVLFGALWTLADPQGPVGQGYKALSRSYDLIGFSPRGTGASTRYYCGSNEQLRFVAHPGADRSADNIRAMLDNARLTAQTCRKNPLTPFINTDATARDLELMRQVLGEQTLNFYFVSYGTWLAAWYASLFPERVGRMLLVGVMDLTVGFDENTLPQAMGRQRVLDEVLAPYAARHPARFGLGDDAEAVRGVYRSLSLPMQDATTQELEGMLAHSALADRTLAVLRAAQVMDEWLKAHPDADEDTLRAMIAATRFVDDPQLDEAARAPALAIGSGWFARLRRATRPVELAPGDAVFKAVVCNDTPVRYDVAGWVRENDLTAARHPFWGGRDTDFPCLFWGGPAVRRPALPTAAGPDGILMLNSQFDPLTVLEGVYRSQAALPNARLIRLDGEHTHGLVLPYGNACVDLPASDYLLLGRLPPSPLRCEGHPLYADAAAARTGKAAAAASNVFVDADTARRLRQRIGEIVGRHPPPRSPAVATDTQPEGTSR